MYKLFLNKKQRKKNKIHKWGKVQAKTTEHIRVRRYRYLSFIT